MSNSIDVSSITNQIEELQSKAADIESAANDASRAAADARTEAETAESRADDAECMADDIQRELGDLISQLEEYEGDGDNDELAELKTVNELLTKELEHERAKFARIIQFVQAIADESITLDDNDADAS